MGYILLHCLQLFFYPCQPVWTRPVPEADRAIAGERQILPGQSAKRKSGATFYTKKLELLIVIAIFHANQFRFQVLLISKNVISEMPFHCS
ncbi:hypothetical protein [Endozoicomonas sp. SESOKO1]|uniref:hypothetical protein n=1 Tax=Endozoicomonas sp. SESOKO1 TaxID=2828742 RepID=UPI002148D1C7|nr:hypothetical protein [Endozoicomonas sp. SESOKO1]